MSDYIVRAAAADLQIRAFAITSRELVEEARSIHNTSPVATAALGRLLSAGAMMGAMMKGEQDLLTLQIKGDGPLGGITVTADAKARVKGYVNEPAVLIHANAKGKLDVAGALGNGMLRVVKDLGLKEPYVGQTELQTGEIAEDLTYYFATSEQVPSSVGLGVLLNRDNTVRQAGGFIIQLMPFTDDKVIDELERKLSGVSSVTSLLDQGLTPEELLQKLLGDFGLEITDTLPASYYCNCTRERVEQAIRMIQLDLGKQCEYFESIGKPAEARRLKQRVEYDLEMIKELGYCPGIENYSRYFDGRSPGSRPFCLIDYFPKDYLLIIDESHVTVPQIRGMYGGDHSRKTNLVEYGYRLPAALDNRPLKFGEFEALENQVIYVSATPADYELIKSEGSVVEQFIRPTGLVDPPIEVRPTLHQIDDLVEEIEIRAKKDERVLVTTLTKRMAEELYKYFDRMGIRCRYIHSDVDTLERVQILDDLRAGLFDVLIGVNLLREGLDLPEVSLVAIMDADKEGFLRSARSLTQTAGRAARNVEGRVIMYADRITDSMRATIQDTNRRREKQIRYNNLHGIVPHQAVKSGRTILSGEPLQSKSEPGGVTYDLSGDRKFAVAADPVAAYMTEHDIESAIRMAREAMEQAARELDFTTAAAYRDKMYALQEQQKNRKPK